MSLTLIHNASVVNEGTITRASVVIDGDIIVGLYGEDKIPPLEYSQTIQAEGSYLFPGVIDDHVHFREPGLTHKATISSESHAAAAGGVTSFFDMPNCIPTTTTKSALREKEAIAATSSIINYSFYIGATKDNLQEIESVDPTTTCGVKLFMGSSTGDMLLDDADVIRDIFKAAPIPVAAHCEDNSIINRNLEKYTKSLYHEPPVSYHPLVRSEEACYASTSKAIDIASGTDVHLHILHISTAKELSLFSAGPVESKRITAEACPAHLCFSNEDYVRLGTRIKCNPSIKFSADRDALRRALTQGIIDVIGTDHAPHLLSEKVGGCRTAASGMPILPYSLTSILQLSDAGILSLTDIARLMCHNPARLFNVKQRGFIRPGYKADLTMVSRNDEGTKVNESKLVNKCGWSPFVGSIMHWKVDRTWVNGIEVYCNGIFNDSSFGELIEFSR